MMLEEEIRRRNTLDLMGRVAGYDVSRDAWEKQSQHNLEETNILRSATKEQLEEYKRLYDVYMNAQHDYISYRNYLLGQASYIDTISTEEGIEKSWLNVMNQRD